MGGICLIQVTQDGGNTVLGDLETAVLNAIVAYVDFIVVILELNSQTYC